jgi:myosin heavy subunit
VDTKAVKGKIIRLERTRCGTFLELTLIFVSRWIKLRRAQAAHLLTNSCRMQISRRKYDRARKGTIKYQATFRGFTKRRILAAIKIQTCLRKYKRHSNYQKMKSAILALQCATRVKIANKELKGLMGEQKDIGKLKLNNDKLKNEMQSLKAMLAAQAKEGASSLAHTQELDSKQQQIDDLEKRIAELEKQLVSEKAIVEKLEADLKAQQEAALDAAHSQHPTPGSPRGSVHRKRSGMSPAYQTSSRDIPMYASGDLGSSSLLQMPNLPTNFVSPEVVAQHKAQLVRFEEELKTERKIRREADGEIIKLRAAINGVQLNDSEVDALLAQKMESAPKIEKQRYVLLFSTLFHHVCRARSSCLIRTVCPPCTAVCNCKSVCLCQYSCMDLSLMRSCKIGS